MSVGIFQFATARPPRQVAADPPSASISPRLKRCSLTDWLSKIAAMRVGLRRTLRRPGERLWLLLHAPSLLDGPYSAAQAVTLPEDDFHRLAVRRATWARR